jgi:hypothetical protein
LARAWQEPIKQSADAPWVALGGRVQEVLQLGKNLFDG